MVVNVEVATVDRRNERTDSCASDPFTIPNSEPDCLKNRGSPFSLAFLLVSPWWSHADRDFSL